MMRSSINAKTKLLREKFAANRSFSDSWDMNTKKHEITTTKQQITNPCQSTPNCYVPYSEIQDEAYTKGSLINLAEETDQEALRWSNMPLSPSMDERTTNIIPIRKTQTQPELAFIKTNSISTRRERLQKGSSMSVDTGLKIMPDDIDEMIKERNTYRLNKSKQSDLSLPDVNSKNIISHTRGRLSPPPFKPKNNDGDDQDNVPPVQSSSRKSSSSTSRRDSSRVPKPCGFDRPLITFCFELTPSSSTPMSCKSVAYDASVASSQAQWNTLKMSDAQHQFLHPDGKFQFVYLSSTFKSYGTLNYAQIQLLPGFVDYILNSIHILPGRVCRA